RRHTRFSRDWSSDVCSSDLEHAFEADFSIVKAWKGDHAGNLIFKGSARNFNAPMAGAGMITIAEVEELVEPGQLDPNEIHIPGKIGKRRVGKECRARGAPGH